jgi:hypothetical protein
MKISLWLAMTAALTVSMLSAQGTGQISGRVLDASGAAIPGTSIQLFVQGGATPIAVQETNQEGLFQFVGVRPINYDLAVEAKGFQKQILRGIKVDAGLTLALPPLTLEVSTQAEVVEVTAEVQGVQTSNAEIATSVTNEQIRRLPQLNRSPLALITTQAGVNSNNRSNTTINGMRAVVHQRDHRRHQHPGQFHPHERPRLSAEHAADGPGGGNDDYDVEHHRRRWFRRFADQVRHAFGHERVSRIAVLVQPQQHRFGEHLVRQPEQHAASVPEPEPGGRFAGRPGGEGQAVFLRQL